MSISLRWFKVHSRHPFSRFNDDQHQGQGGAGGKKEKRKGGREEAGGQPGGRWREGELTLRRFFDNLNSLIIVWTLLYHTKKGGKK